MQLWKHIFSKQIDSKITLLNVIPSKKVEGFIDVTFNLGNLLKNAS